MTEEPEYTKEDAEAVDWLLEVRRLQTENGLTTAEAIIEAHRRIEENNR